MVMMSRVVLCLLKLEVYVRESPHPLQVLQQASVAPHLEALLPVSTPQGLAVLP